MNSEYTPPSFLQNSLSESDSSTFSATDVWNQCLDIIRGRVNNQSFKAWFEPVVPLRFDGKRFVIQVPSQFFSDWLEEHYYSLIYEVLTQVTKKEVALEYEFFIEEREIAPPADQAGPDRPPRQSAESLITAYSKSKNAVSQEYCELSLNPKYTFENYIKGDSNQFARAAALAVANNPGGTSFNPLVIYGGVGLGKTHLVHSIGNSLLQSGKTQRVLYVSSEKFTVDFVEAIQQDNVNAFSNQYRSVDVLIVDDIQFFAGKEKTQDTFFHTFNTLHHLGKQIVLSSDKPPKDLKGLTDRLISRFQWGLTADIQPPDLETRIAILRKKSSDDGIELSQEVVEFMASNVTTNIRELEGCLISLLARASLESRTIDLALAKDVVRSIIGEVRTHVTVEEIQRTVCDHLQIPQDLIRAKTRKQEVVNARQIAMYLTKELTNSSLKTIGLHFGGRDHSTVIHAYQTIEDSMKNDLKQRNIVQQLRSKLELGMR
ncbi:MAG TPA: chromosomal replication initiator protein DnaA [Bacteroidota bacterium]|nr:chromosomal replication initiator protein DnaA [Bacteroidota bacterium]